MYLADEHLVLPIPRDGRKTKCSPLGEEVSRIAHFTSIPVCKTLRSTTGHAIVNSSIRQSR